jgi:hypothetical protein
VPNPYGYKPPEDDSEYDKPTEQAAVALARHLGDLSSEAVSINVDAAGDLLSVCTDPEMDSSLQTGYFLLQDIKFRCALPPKRSCDPIPPMSGISRHMSIWFRICFQ